MVQELHVLGCCSCETFQTHVVKKTNKWECKVCGTKQSVKKVYGRGSGKDCRLHTQKLNALKGEKGEVGLVSKILNDTNGKPSEQIEVNLQCSATNTEEKLDSPKASKWAEYVDEVKIDVSKTKCLTEDGTIKKCETGVERKDHRGPKTKRSFDIYSNDFENDLDSFVENDNTSFSLQTSKKNYKRGKYVERCNTNLNEHNNYNLDKSLKPTANEQSKSSNFVIEKQSQQNVKANVSLKWSKYLNEESVDEKSHHSENTSESPDPKKDYISSEKTGNILDSLGNSECVISYGKTETFHSSNNSMNNSCNFNFNGGKNNSEIQFKIFDRKSVVDSCEESTIKREEIDQNKQKSNHDSAMSYPLPVFEQFHEVNENYFELDF